MYLQYLYQTLPSQWLVCSDERQGVPTSWREAWLRKALEAFALQRGSAASSGILSSVCVERERRQYLL